MNIFVSYTLRDGVLNMSKLRQIETFLSQYGNPYIDLLHNNIQAHPSCVISALKQSSILCAYVTPGFLNSKWVQFELSLAQKYDIPLLWCNVNSPIMNSTKNVAQQSVHLTLGILRKSQAFFYALSFSGRTASPSLPQRR